MTVRVEERHLAICDNIAKEVNKEVETFSLKRYKADTKKYELLLKKTNISIEGKKEQLMNALHKLLISSIALEPAKAEAREKEIIDELSSKARILRGITYKLRDINYYLENIFLEEIGLAKRHIGWRLLQKKDAINAEKRETGRIGGEEIEKLEYTILRLIEKTITIDKRLLKDYKKREAKIAERETLELTHIISVLRKEADLIEYIEAKLPPPGKVNRVLLKPEIFHKWSVMLAALLASFENEYEKERSLFSRLKKNKTLKKRIELKISHIINEKFELMRIKQQRIMAWEASGRIDPKAHEATHAYLAASKL